MIGLPNIAIFFFDPPSSTWISLSQNRNDEEDDASRGQTTILYVNLKSFDTGSCIFMPFITTRRSSWEWQHHHNKLLLTIIASQAFSILDHSPFLNQTERSFWFPLLIDSRLPPNWFIPFHLLNFRNHNHKEKTSFHNIIIDLHYSTRFDCQPSFFDHNFTTYPVDRSQGILDPPTNHNRVNCRPSPDHTHNNIILSSSSSSLASIIL